MGDWIEGFMEWTQGVATPEVFRLWSAIAAVASSMERKCWTRNARGVLYPSLFTMLVASPGIGKTEAIKRAELLIRKCKKVNVLPRSITGAAIIDSLNSCEKTYMNGSGTPVPYHPGMIIVSELGSFLAAHDLEFLSLLNDLIDSPSEYEQKRRHFNSGDAIAIDSPSLNILAGTQPAFLQHLLPEEAWNMGATSRMIMIYSGEHKDESDDFGEVLPEDIVPPAKLIGRLGAFGEKSGEFVWEPRAMDMYNAWKRSGYKPIPTHSKLVNYLPRRRIAIIKLAMISAMSQSGALRVSAEDFIRATDWLFVAEVAMPDIFREMVGKGDNEVIMELHYFMWQTQVQRKAKSKPGNLAEGELYNFLRMKVPSEKIARVIEVAERSNVIRRSAEDPAKWEARPKHMHGVE